jgi:hypothetical protein
LLYEWLSSQSASPGELRGARMTRDDGSGLPSQSVCSPQCSHQCSTGLPSQQAHQEIRWRSPDELRGARKTRDDGSGLPSQSVCSPQCSQQAHHQCSTGLPSQQAHQEIRRRGPDELRGARKTRDDGSGLPSQSVCSTGLSGPVVAQAKAAPWPPSQPERPGIDFSYSTASARGLKFRTLLSRLCNLESTGIEAAAASI